MEKATKKRLFEVMSRLDPTFKPRLNEDFDQLGTEEEPEVTTPEIGAEESPEIEEKTPEQKLEELTAKVDELYDLIHGGNEESEELPDEPEELENENLYEWNFDKKKGDKKESKFEKGEDKETKKHEDSETPEEEEKEHKDKKELGESTPPKIPVVPIAKVGK